MIVRGRNSLTLSAADEGTWIVTLQLARRRTLDQVSASFSQRGWEGWELCRDGALWWPAVAVCRCQLQTAVHLLLVAAVCLQVKALMAPPESLSEAVARVRRQVGGGGGGDDSGGWSAAAQLHQC